MDRRLHLPVISPSRLPPDSIRRDVKLRARRSNHKANPPAFGSPTLQKTTLTQASGNTFPQPYRPTRESVRGKTAGGGVSKRRALGSCNRLNSGSPQRHSRKSSSLTLKNKDGIEEVRIEHTERLQSPSKVLRAPFFFI